jgi:RNase P subunit RPR2
MVLNEQPASTPPTESEPGAVRPAHCPRCQGFLIPVRYGEWGRMTGTQADCAWSCVQCGAIIDPVILANRRGRRTQIVRTLINR